MKNFDAAILPSRTLPYRFKSIEMRPFLVPQIMQLSRAAALNSITPMIKALGSVINVKVDELTDGDFYYLLAYQRLVSYKEHSLFVRWACDGLTYEDDKGRRFTAKQLNEYVTAYDEASPEERAKLEDPSALRVKSARCNHENEHAVTMDDLVVVRLPESITLPEGLDFPRVATLQDTVEMRKDPERSAIVDAARWVAAGSTLAEKIEYLEKQPDLSLFERALYAHKTIAHGVSRIVMRRCEVCDEPSHHTFDITPDTFFDV